MRILFIGAGRRYSLVERFKEAGFEVFSIETEENAPISKICTVKYLRAKSPAVQSCIIREYMNKHNIPFYIPFVESMTINPGFDLIGLGVQSDLFASRVCFDKAAFHTYMMQYCKAYYPYVKYPYNVIVKPRYGNGSKGIKEVGFFQSLFYSGVKQRKLVGTEISVDAYFNLQNKMLFALPRERNRIAGGEVVDSKVVKNDVLVRYTQTIGERIGLNGPACFQYRYCEHDRQYKIMEINARFGGGVILSLEAGFDMIDLIKKEYYENRVVTPYCVRFNINYDLIMRRVNRETFF